jgi:F-type H+-transporting ATPase subunit delta
MTDASDARNKHYAEALYVIARTEGKADEVGNELFKFSQALEGSDELRTALTDPHVPTSRRQQIVEDLLGGKANDVTMAIVSMVVGAGRAHDLPGIISHLVNMTAEENNLAVAEVRSAIELTDDQRARLAVALAKAVGRPVEVKVIIDPSVLGGIITQIGDTVIDGSVRHRLGQLREAI